MFVFAWTNLSQSWPGHKPLIQATVIYTTLDTMWIAARPQLVPGPLGIIFHHMFVLALCVYTLTIGEAHAVYGSAMLLVELNSSLNMLRRLLHHPMWCELLFLSSWVALRLVWIPAIATLFVLSASGVKEFPEILRMLVPMDGVEQAQIPIFVAASASALAFLQYYWTFTLGKNVLQRAFRKPNKKAQ